MSAVTDTTAVKKKKAASGAREVLKATVAANSSSRGVKEVDMDKDSMAVDRKTLEVSTKDVVTIGMRKKEA